MSSKWLHIESFDNGHELLLAVNRLLIHLKLEKDGLDSPVTDDDVSEAREIVTRFLRVLARHCVAHRPDSPFLGVDARRRELFSTYVEARKRPDEFRSRLFRTDLTELTERLDQGLTESDDDSMIESLADLRTLVEEHLHSDKKRLLGDW